jgi:hypothetical protein
MAENKKSFVLYVNQRAQFDQLNDEQAGQLIKHLFAYVNDENPQSDDLIINLAFTPIMQALKRDLVKYEERAERSRKNGKKGGRPTNPQEPKEPTGFSGLPQEPEKPDSVNGSVSDNDSGTDNGILLEKETKKTFKFKTYLIGQGFKESLIDDWLAVRKNKKATNTKTALDGFIKEVEKSGKDKNEILKMCVEKSWSGFNAGWLNNTSNGQPKEGGHHLDTDIDYSKAKL